MRPETGGRAPPEDKPRAPDPTSNDLADQMASAGRGLAALIAARPDWPIFFDLSTTGFLRSFIGPVLALPMHLFAFAVVERTILGGKTMPAADFGWVALAHVIDMLTFPLLIALLAKPLRIGGGYPAFITVMNWASLFLNLAFAAAALLALGGPDGVEMFRFAYLILLCFSVFFVWRSGRLTLSREAAPVLLVVVLSVAVGAGADQLAGWILSVA
ncbi:MAG: hypothetical protein ACYDD1_11965 [Caulobacteraceae bacterium]